MNGDTHVPGHSAVALRSPGACAPSLSEALRLTPVDADGAALDAARRFLVRWPWCSPRPAARAM